MIVKQIDIDEVQPLDLVWSIHDKEWVLVIRVFKPEDGVLVELDCGTFTISAEFGHQMFRRMREGEV